MIEIKFRAWDDKKKKMFRVERLGWILLGSPENIEGVSVTDGKNDWHSGRGHVIMQYTGLKDKDEQEIYEGDIIKLYDQLMLIKWNKARSGFSLYELDNEKYNDEYDMRNASNGLIVGNIYENAKLVNKAQIK